MTRILYFIYFAGHLIVLTLYIVAAETLLAAFSLSPRPRGLRKRGTEEQPLREVAQTGYASLGQTQQRSNDTPTTSQSSDVPTDDERVSLNPTHEANGTVPTIYRFYLSRTYFAISFAILNVMKVLSFIIYFIVVAHGW